jgi:hypothetical protein
VTVDDFCMDIFETAGEAAPAIQQHLGKRCQQMVMDCRDAGGKGWDDLRVDGIRVTSPKSTSASGIAALSVSDEPGSCCVAVGLGLGGGVGDDRFAVADEAALAGERLQVAAPGAFGLLTHHPIFGSVTRPLRWPPSRRENGTASVRDADISVMPFELVVSVWRWEPPTGTVDCCREHADQTLEALWFLRTGAPG